MKSLFALTALSFCLALTGCETFRSDISSGVKEKFSGPVYRTRVVAGEQRKVYQAAKDAVNSLGFRFIGGGPAQGKLEALSSVSSGASLKSSRQLRLQVKISPSGDGSEVAALFTEVIEDDFNKGAGLATENSLRETSLYEVFFRYIEQGLAKPVE